HVRYRRSEPPVGVLQDHLIVLTCLGLPQHLSVASNGSATHVTRTSVRPVRYLFDFSWVYLDQTG
ncbi:MAG: hypothetical protein VX846_03225, partial [Actinomycetota bacterium]|nr:hypothetical protein [Actinomycetota bacterium]